MRATEPVFIVGQPRSGTSLLYRLIQQHPRFRCRELNLAEAKVWDHIGLAHRFGGREPETFFQFLCRDEERYRAFLADVAPVGRRQGRMVSMIGPRLQGKSLMLWRLARNHQVLHALGYHGWLARGCERLVEKTPTSVFHLEKLVSAFPRCKMLCLHRHPVDVYASYRRRARVEGATWADLSLDAFVAFRVRTASLVSRFARRHPGGLWSSSYEDLVGDTEGSLRHVCGFLGEAFVPELLSAPATARHSTADPHLFGPVAARTKDWRAFVGEAEAAELCRRLAPVMGALGYPPGPPA
jgi:hypothetical protein